MGLDLSHIPKICNKETNKDESECSSESFLGSLIAFNDFISYQWV